MLKRRVLLVTRLKTMEIQIHIGESWLELIGLHDVAQLFFLACTDLEQKHRVFYFAQL